MEKCELCKMDIDLCICDDMPLDDEWLSPLGKVITVSDDDYLIVE